MKKFKFKRLEQEQWERHYEVEANSEEEAREYFEENGFEDPIFEELYDFEVGIEEEELIE